MEKMRLMLDDLAVQSFQTGEGMVDQEGSVLAHSYTGDANQATCVEYTCEWRSGEDMTCGSSCDCLSAWCNQSANCPTGGHCYGTFYGSGFGC